MDINFSGECITNERLKSDDYEDHFQSTKSNSILKHSNQEDGEDRLLLMLPRSCPS